MPQLGEASDALNTLVALMDRLRNGKGLGCSAPSG
jgi:hypothetical protein